MHSQPSLHSQETQRWQIQHQLLLFASSLSRKAKWYIRILFVFPEESVLYGIVANLKSLQCQPTVVIFLAKLIHNNKLFHLISYANSAPMFRYVDQLPGRVEIAPLSSLRTVTSGLFLWTCELTRKCPSDVLQLLTWLRSA